MGKNMFYKKQLQKNIGLMPLFNFLIYTKLFTGIISVYFAKVTGSYAVGISLFAIIQVSLALMEVPTGVFSDTLGRRKCLIIGAVLSLMSVLFFAIGSSYLILALGAMFVGISEAFFSGNNEALLYESLDGVDKKGKYDQKLGEVRSSMEFSFLVGGVVGGIIAIWSVSLLMWLSLIPQIFGVWLSFQFSEPPNKRSGVGNVYAHLKEAVNLFKTNIQMRRLSLAGIISEGGGAGWPLFALFYNTLLPVSLVSFMVSANFLISSISYRLSGKVIKRFSAIRLLIIDKMFGRIINIFALSFPTILSPPMMALGSIFYGPAEVAQNTLLQLEFSDKQRATMASLNSLFGNAFYVVCATTLGLLADKIGVAKTLLLAQFLTVPVLSLYLKFSRDSKKRGVN